jgi:hypothetical protein
MGGHTTTKIIEMHDEKWIKENRTDMPLHGSKLLNKIRGVA